MKRCYRCKVELPRTSFNGSPKNRDGLHSYCRECQKAHYRENAARHAANVRATSARRLIEARRFVIARLAAGCVDCGNVDLRVLEFNHVRGEKVDSIANLVRRGRSLDVIEAEIRKCDVRCRNCHAIVTIARRGRSWHHELLDEWGRASPRRDSNSRPSG